MLPTPEEIKIVELVTAHGYNAEQLELLLRHVGRNNLPDFIKANNEVMEDYLCSTDNVTGEALTGLCTMFSFYRSLLKIACKANR